MAELIIHIGTQKTGTSVLQEFMSKNRERLVGQDVNYPLWGRGLEQSAGQHAHHMLAHHWGPGWLSDRFSTDEIVRAWAGFVETLSKQADRKFIISSEHFYKVGVTDPSVPKAIKESLPADVDAKIVIYFRRPDQFALSNWAHGIKTIRDFRTTFRDYVESSTLSALLSYRKNVALWQDAFGEENVIVRAYDRKVFLNGNILDDFLEIAGVSAGQEMETVGNVNVSLSPFTLDFLCDLNREEIYRYAQFMATLDAYAAKHMTKRGMRRYDPLTNDLANQLLDKFGEDFAYIWKLAQGEDLDIDRLRPKGKGQVHRPVPQSMKDFAIQLWMPVSQKEAEAYL